MKNYKKHIAINLLLISVIFSCLCISNVSAMENCKKIYVNSANEYSKLIFQDVCKTIYMSRHDLGIDNVNIKEMRYGEEFVICDLDQECQDEIYYYPILDKDENIIAILGVIGTIEGWTYTITTEYVQELNNIPHTNNLFVFESDDSVVVETSDKTYNIVGHCNPRLAKVKFKINKNREKIIRKTIENFKKSNPNNNCDADDQYTPKFSESENNRKICALNNPVYQGNTNLCWAASVATIVNYRLGKNINHLDVASKMGINNKGATPGVAQSALYAYGVAYNNLNLDSSAKMNWNNVVLNISHKYPIYVSAKSSNSGHAVTVFGYRTVSLTDYVSIWDSATGSSMAVPFKAGGTVFSVGNKAYTWKYSISVY